MSVSNGDNHLTSICIDIETVYIGLIEDYEKNFWSCDKQVQKKIPCPVNFIYQYQTFLKNNFNIDISRYIFINMAPALLATPPPPN